MKWNSWESKWEAALAACDRMGGEITPVTIEPPASERDVQRVEQSLGRPLPSAFRTVLTRFSGGVFFSWYLPEKRELPEALQGIFSGGCEWNLEHLTGMDERCRSWAKSCCPNPDDPYDRVWYNKLPFHTVANGDYLTIDLNAGERFPVVYLSHDGGSGHGLELGEDFIDFVSRWSRIGCPGAEDWQWLPFMSETGRFIDPLCANADLWRRWFGLQIPET
jgi:hypothetical protein